MFLLNIFIGLIASYNKNNTCVYRYTNILSLNYFKKMFGNVQKAIKNYIIFICSYCVINKKYLHFAGILIF